MPVTEGSLTTVGSPLRMFQGTEAQHITGYNTTSLGNDVINIRGHDQSGESGELFMLSSYQPRGPPETTTIGRLVESRGDTIWTNEVIRLDRQIRFKIPHHMHLCNFD
ncbi:hypothetical protein BDR04DRAFT_1107302 [Suillus decipiens]|nr:hypothetical protein BDR04DRAFT_1107302 [Suillus decipiens]